VIGDTASLDQDGKPLPGVAQVAMQQGKYAAKSHFAQSDWAASTAAISLF
jgi:NADH dehydrogenase FAD-containing subunit